jgi:hypothetical protein
VCWWWYFLDKLWKRPRRKKLDVFPPVKVILTPFHHLFPPFLFEIKKNNNIFPPELKGNDWRKRRFDSSSATPLRQIRFVEKKLILRLMEAPRESTQQHHGKSNYPANALKREEESNRKEATFFLF